jgi:Protein of unknown function, DUF547
VWIELQSSGHEYTARAALVHNSHSSCARRLAWFGAVRYNIGGMEFSCNDIEHGVLRGNAPSPASLGVLLGRPRWASNTFKKKDPRARLVRDSQRRPIPAAPDARSATSVWPLPGGCTRQHAPKSCTRHLRSSRPSKAESFANK